jgi:diguanylate cyclase (GGDEF)-like protein/PAS domain S-box-containing protein
LRRFSQRTLALAFTIAIASLLALALYSYVTAQHADQAAADVLHSEQALSDLNLLRAQIADLASLPVDIKQTIATADSLRRTIGALRAITAGDTVSSRALTELTPLIAPGMTDPAAQHELRQRLDALTDEQRSAYTMRVAGAAAAAEAAADVRRIVFAASLTLLLTSFWVLGGAMTRRRLEDQRERFFQVSLDMLVFAGFDGYFKRLNPAWERTLGYTIEELMSKPQIEFVHPDDREATLRQAAVVAAGGTAAGFENRYRCKDGTYKWLLWNAVPSREHQTIYAVARDLTERKLSEAQLRELSLRDDLTSLRNRRGFLLLAEQELKLVRDRRRDAPDIHLWLIFTDLDGLKHINDEFGHDVGSEAIVHAANILTRTFRDSDIIARMGGDEFAVLALTNESEGGQTMVTRMQNALARFNAEESLPYRLSLSIGAVKVDADGTSPIEEVLKEADRQMYEHKRSDKRSADRWRA